MKTALLLIDIQNEYFAGGKRELVGSLEAVAQARRLLDWFRRHAWPTVHIQHVSLEPDAASFLPGSNGVQIHASVEPRPGETVIQKHYPNSFRETRLFDHLKDLAIERLVLCGMMTHMCVDATMRAGADIGFPILLAADACATRDLIYNETSIPAEYVHKAFLVALKSYGLVLRVDQVIDLLAKS
jgi:nicotinamidase-related amidase